MTERAAMQRYAHEVADERLRREGGLIGRLSAADRQAVEDVAHAVASRVAEALVDAASLLAREFEEEGRAAAFGAGVRLRPERAEKEGFEPSKEVITPLTP